jgi:serine/threonine protein kinase
MPSAANFPFDAATKELTPMSSSSIEERLDELLRRWDELRQQGRDLSAEELCGEFSEHVPELRRRIAVVRAMGPVLEAESTEFAATPCVPGSGSVRARPELPVSLHASAVYRPQRRHAEGGLGEVLAAHQDELDRLVALKRIRPVRLDATARRRFLREAAITAKLQHPGIVPIYDLGQDEHGPFYTMPLIAGQTLQEAIDALHGSESVPREPGQQILKLRGLLQRFIAVCNTVAYAHAQGVVHRDLKPANIMLGPYGETLVVDWGLAKRSGVNDTTAELEEEASSPSPLPGNLTDVGSVLGTPQYMSPEQAMGHPAGPASDIYSLGATLYVILTGKVPFEGRGALVVSRKQKEGVPAPPRNVNSSVPRPLEAVCLKAMAFRPEDRYVSARALAQDLERWLADEPVSAWHEPISARARRLMRRHRAWVLASAVTLITVSLGLAVSLAVVGAKNVTLDRERRRADANAAFLLQGLTEALKKLANPALTKDPECRDSVLAALREGEAIYLDQMSSEQKLRNSTLPSGEYWVHVALLRTAAGDREGTLEAYHRVLDSGVAYARAHPDDPEGWSCLAGTRTHLGLELWVRGRRDEGRDQLRLGTEEFRRALDADLDNPRIQRAAAWHHIFCPDPRLRDERLALELAQHFVGQASVQGRDRPRFSEGIRPLFTLALAQYRTGDWPAARSSIEESIRIKAAKLGETSLERLIEKRTVIDAYDWFVWSMALARLGDPESARLRFEDATQWMRRYRYGDFELHLLHDEAASLLGLSSPGLPSDPDDQPAAAE